MSAFVADYKPGVTPGGERGRKENRAGASGSAAESRNSSSCGKRAAGPLSLSHLRGGRLGPDAAPGSGRPRAPASLGAACAAPGAQRERCLRPFCRSPRRPPLSPLYFPSRSSPPPHPVTIFFFFHRQNVLINLLLLFPDLTWWPTQSTTLTKRSLRDKTRLTSEEQGKCFRGRGQFLTWTPTRTGAARGGVGVGKDFPRSLSAPPNPVLRLHLLLPRTATPGPRAGRPPAALSPRAAFLRRPPRPQSGAPLVPQPGRYLGWLLLNRRALWHVG